MTRHRALKLMRRLFPSVALREAYCRRVPNRQVEVGVELRCGPGGQRGPREPIVAWRAQSWEKAINRAQLFARR